MRVVLIVGFLLFAIGTLATSFTLVKPGERAVVRRFGAILPDKPEPGLLFQLPWGMDRVDRVRVDERRTINVGWIEPASKENEQPEQTVAPEGQLLTGDHNLVNAQAAIHYRVVGTEVDRFVLHGDQVEPLIARATEAALAQWLAGRMVDDILLHGRSQLPSWLVEEVQNRLAPYQLGVRIEQADVKLFPPSEVSPYFDAVSQQHERMETQVREAKRRANDKASNAEVRCIRIRHNTTAYVQEQNSAAKADAETFLKHLDQYRLLSANNPNYLNTLWLDETTRLYTVMRRSGRIDLLDHHIGSDGLNVTQFPLLPRRK